MASGPVRLRFRVKSLPSHKYHAMPVVEDGVFFASQKEAKRYRELRLLEKAGEIHALELQPRFVLSVVPLNGGTTIGIPIGGVVHVYGVQGGRPVAGIAIGEYRGDFMYCECRRGEQCELTQRVVEDVKGFKTPLYLWKKRHMCAQYGITIREI